MEILNAVLGWINENDGTIIALATVVLVGVTWRYVHLTGKLVKAANTPEVAIYLKNEGYDVMLCVENIGTRAAHNINFLKKSYRIKEEDSFNNVEFLKTGIKYLPPKHTIEESFYSMEAGVSLNQILIENPVTIYIEYSRSKGRFRLKFKDEFELFAEEE